MTNPWVPFRDYDKPGINPSWFWAFNPKLHRLEYAPHGSIGSCYAGHYVTVETDDCGIKCLVVRGVVPAGYDNVDYEEWYPLELVEQLIRAFRNANQDRN